MPVVFELYLYRSQEDLVLITSDRQSIFKYCHYSPPSPNNGRETATKAVVLALFVGPGQPIHQLITRCGNKFKMCRHGDSDDNAL